MLVSRSRVREFAKNTCRFLPFFFLSSSFHSFQTTRWGSADSLFYSHEQTEHDNDLFSSPYTLQRIVFRLLFTRITSVDCHDASKRSRCTNRYSSRIDPTSLDYWCSYFLYTVKWLHAMIQGRMNISEGYCMEMIENWSSRCRVAFSDMFR